MDFTGTDSRALQTEERAHHVSGTAHPEVRIKNDCLFAGNSCAGQANQQDCGRIDCRAGRQFVSHFTSAAAVERDFACKLVARRPVELH
jgi:hypothetical protein